MPGIDGSFYWNQKPMFRLNWLSDDFESLAMEKATGPKKLL